MADQDRPEVDWSRALYAWLKHLKREMVRSTQAAYLREVKKYLAWLAAQDKTPDQVLPGDVVRWRDELLTHLSPVTVARYLSAVRSFYTWLRRAGLVKSNPTERVRAGRRGRGRERKRQELTDSEVLRVLSTCGNADLCRRDRAILALMAYGAAGTIEAYRANVGDLQKTDKGRLVLWLQGKGRREPDSYIVLPAAADQALRDWLAVHPRPAGPLFVSLSRRTFGRRLSARAIRAMVKRRFRRAGVPEDKTAESLRLAAIGNAIRHGANPQQVRALARHSRIETALSYYRAGSQSKAPAADRIDYYPTDQVP